MTPLLPDESPTEAVPPLTSLSIDEIWTHRDELIGVLMEATDKEDFIRRWQKAPVSFDTSPALDTDTVTPIVLLPEESSEATESTNAERITALEGKVTLIIRALLDKDLEPLREAREGEVMQIIRSIADEPTPRPRPLPADIHQRGFLKETAAAALLAKYQKPRAPTART